MIWGPLWRLGVTRRRIEESAQEIQRLEARIRDQASVLLEHTAEDDDLHQEVLRILRALDSQ